MFAPAETPLHLGKLPTPKSPADSNSRPAELGVPSADQRPPNKHRERVKGRKDGSERSKEREGESGREEREKGRRERERAGEKRRGERGEERRAWETEGDVKR